MPITDLRYAPDGNIYFTTGGGPAPLAPRSSPAALLEAGGASTPGAVPPSSATGQAD